MASKAQKREKARAARLKQQELHQRKEQAELEDLEEVEEVEKEVKAEPVEKDYMEGMYVGPTSLEEMDALDHAREQAMEVNRITWRVEDVVRNILQHPMMSPDEKSTAMKKVADGFGTRVSAVMKDCNTNVKKDLEILEIEAILAEDRRHAGPLEFVGDVISKAVLTAKRENALSDEQFALVRGEGDQKVRKYPIHDKAHVRNALARAAQMMAAGGEAAADAKAAMPKIRAAAKRMGIEMSVEKGLMIEKDLNGDWRYVGSPTNNFIDFDTDILSKESHAEYATWWEEHKEFSPVFTTWHLPGMVRKSAADLVMEHEGFLIVSGKLTEEETEGLLKAKILTDIGMSHQSLALARDPQDRRVVTKYRMYEFSDLPLENAANPFTSLEVVSKEADMDKQKYLAQFMPGEDEKAKLEKANAFLSTIGVKKEALQEAGIESKEVKEEKPATPPATPETPAPPPAQPVAVDQKAILEAVIKETGMEDLAKVITQLQETAEKVPLLEALVKEMQGKKDDELAKMITPPVARFPWMEKARASQDPKTAVEEGNEEDKKLSKAKPEVGWLAEVLHVDPVNVQQ